MQKTHSPDSAVAFPEELGVTDVNVYTDGMMAIHDYSCPVCRNNHAILDLSVGLMRPCMPCQSHGYQLMAPREVIGLLNIGTNRGIIKASAIVSAFWLYILWLF